MIPDEHDPLAFTQLVLQLLDEGRRHATYKLAVLLALLDTCAASGDDAGRAPSQISTRDLARSVARLYWTQVRPFEQGAVLKQAAGARAITVDAVSALRQESQLRGATTFASAELRCQEAVERCLDVVELNLVRMPLGKLQRPLSFREGSDYPRFLYDDDAFHERVTRAQLDRRPLSVQLRPGAADTLVSLAGLLRPLIELHWTRQVAELNRISLAEDGLRSFLFGTQRSALTRLAPALVELQSGRCFYCTGPLPSDVHVDHFVPWSRIPNDGLANLVAADAACNGSKRDNYADLALLERWAERPRQALSDAATSLDWPLRLTESLGTARSLYGHLPAGSRLWTGRGVFALLDPTRLSDLLPSLTP